MLASGWESGEFLEVVCGLLDQISGCFCQVMSWEIISLAHETAYDDSGASQTRSQRLSIRTAPKLIHQALYTLHIALDLKYLYRAGILERGECAVWICFL